MIGRLRGGKAGIVKYFRDGKKAGRPYTRDELDERVVLHGDLDAIDKVIATIVTEGERYLHITLGFAEQDLTNERIRAITDRYMELLMAAYQPEEYMWYSEAHRPRIKRYINRTTGEEVDRLLHAHIVLPKVNLLTGGRLDPIGMALSSVSWLDAIQEQVNNEFGLVSPKDRPRENVSAADMIARSRPTEFKKGKIGDFKRRVANEIIVRDIASKAGLEELLMQYGEVKLRNADKPHQYFAVKPSGQDRFINLRDPIFAECIRPPMPAAYQDWNDIVAKAEGEATLKPAGLVVGVGKKDLEDIALLVEDWVSRRSREIKYLNSGNRKQYQEYRALDTDAQKTYLNGLANAFYTRHNLDRRQHGQGQDRTSHPAPSRPRQTAVDAARKQDARRAADRAPATGIFNLPNLHACKLDRDAHGSEVLLQKPVSDRLGRSGTGGDDALRRAPVADGGSWERAWSGFRAINPATGREADTFVSQLLRDQREAKAHQAADQCADIREIRRQIDAHGLLADLASSHGIRPADYIVTSGRDGAPRIRFRESTANLNASDFLTRHMHLSWPDAEQYLRACYGRQMTGSRAPIPVPSPQPDYWREFQAWWHRERANRRRRERAVITQAKAQQKTLRNEYHRGLSSLERQTLPYSIFRVQRKLLKLALAKSEQDLQKEVRAARARLSELDRADSDRLAYCTWLAERAEAGDWDAIAELRRQRLEAGKSCGPGDHAIVLYGIRLKVQIAQPPDHLTYSVHHNGDVSVYSGTGAEILRDTGSILYVMQIDDDALELCLRMAQKNWGNGNFFLFGDNAFIERAMQVAARRRLNVTFSNDEQNAMLQGAKAHPIPR